MQTVFSEAGTVSFQSDSIAGGYCCAPSHHLEWSVSYLSHNTVTHFRLHFRVYLYCLCFCCGVFKLLCLAAYSWLIRRPRQQPEANLGQTPQTEVAMVFLAQFFPEAAAPGGMLERA